MDQDLQIAVNLLRQLQELTPDLEVDAEAWGATLDMLAELLGLDKELRAR